MKQFLRYIFLLVAFFMATTNVWAQTYNGGTWYSLYDTNTYSRVVRDTYFDNETSVFSPAGSMTFQYKKFSFLSTNGSIEVYNKLANGNWSSSKGGVNHSDYKNWSTSGEITLDANITHIRHKLVTSTGGEIKNIFVKLKKHILLNDNTSNGQTWGVSSITLTDNSLATAEGKTSTSAYTIRFRSFLASGNITIKSNNSEFHFGNGATSISLNTANNYFARIGGTASKSSTNPADHRNVNEYETKVYFSPAVQHDKNTRSTTITISDGTSTAYIYLSAPVIPTYFFKAEAISSPAEGGTATATFENGQNTYSIIAPDYTTGSISTTVTFTATPNSANGYVYDGWKKQLSDVECNPKGAGTESFSEEITSSDLNPNNITSTRTYYAIFTRCYTPIIKGLQDYTNQLIGVPIENLPFQFIDAATEYPSNSEADDFYYTIDHQLDGGSTADCPAEHQGKVIDYYPNEKKIIPRNAGTATITFYHKSTDTHETITPVSVTITVIRHTPVFTWQSKKWNETTTEYFNNTYNDYFVSSSTTNNTSATLTYSSEDNDAAILHAGSSAQTLDLTVFYKETDPLLSIDLTVTQAQNYYWNTLTETHTITPQNPNNHVPFTMNTKDLRMALYEDHEKSYGENQCDDNGTISLNQSGGLEVWTANPLYYTIKFSGIPDKLTFKYKMTLTATAIGETNKAFIVYESANGNDWSELWTTDGMPNNTDYKEVADIQLNPDTRYLKFFYDGTYIGYYSGITVTELNVFEADPTSLDFGAHQVDKTSYPTKTFALHYANAGYKVKLQSTNEKFNVSPTEINTIGGEHYGTYAPITVKYNTSKEHNTDNTGKIIITDECGHQTEVELNGSTYKIPQSLYWTENWQAREPAINVNSTATDLARATSTLEVRYTSSDENIIQVINGTTIHALREGRATITAYQDGTEDWAQAESISKEFIVTNKIIQYIHWTDNLLRLLTTDEPFALNATIQLADTEGNRTDSPERTAKIKYTSGNTDIVSVEGNILTIQGAGETYVVAYEEGDGEYEQVYLVMPVRVRIPSTGCDPKVLEQETEISFFQMNTNEIIKDAIEIDRTKGIPGKLSFQHKGEKWISIFYTGSIKAQQSTDNGNNWSDIDGSSITPTVNEYKELANLALDERATHIRFVRPSGGQGYHYVKDIEITPAQYIRSNTYKIDFGEIVIGSDETKPFAISYSNMQSEFHMVTSHTDLTLSNSIMVDDCGAWGEETHTVRFKPTSAGAFNETIIVYDDISQLSCTIQVVANIIKGGQDIVWNPLANELRESNDWRSGYTKNAYSTVGLDITYTMQPNAYAHFDANGHLVIDQTGGSITITASQAGNDNFNEATSVSKTFNIPADLSPLTFIGGHAENDWSNTLNWNYNRLPKETESILLQAPAQLTTNATVSGITLIKGPSEEIGSIHIKPTGGLTIGNNGIIGANADGSSIVIDNLKTGAGFLRISPDCHETMPHFTMRYETASTLDDGANLDATWQYIGAPGADCQFTVDYITWLYHWSEKEGWINKTGTLTLEPFAGYAITQYGKPTYELVSTVINEDKTITLTKTTGDTSMNGDNLFANSYSAPIDAKNFTPEDFSDYGKGSDDIVKTFYIFNSGSWNDWNKNQNSTLGSNNSDTPGQYRAIPALAASYIDANYDHTTIPPMQGVYVIANANGASIKLNYDKHVWKAGSAAGTNMHEPMRAPIHNVFKPDNFRRLRIQVNSANSGADRMYVIQDTITTTDYDNGYDAPNQSAEGLANIYTNEHFGQMEVSCSNHIDSTFVGFTAGSDSIYTLRFNAIIGDDLHLLDLNNDSLILLEEDATYTFHATPHSKNDLRFQILLHPEKNLDFGEEEKDEIYTGITDVHTTQVWSHGSSIYISNAPTNTIATLYNISGHKLLTTPIHHTPYTLDLSYLPKGVYMLQLNTQVYKFVIQ